VGVGVEPAERKEGLRPPSGLSLEVPEGSSAWGLSRIDLPPGGFQKPEAWAGVAVTDEQNRPVLGQRGLPSEERQGSRTMVNLSASRTGPERTFPRIGGLPGPRRS
jgi:hypothetical protein